MNKIDNFDFIRKTQEDFFAACRSLETRLFAFSLQYLLEERLTQKNSRLYTSIGINSYALELPYPCM